MRDRRGLFAWSAALGGGRRRLSVVVTPGDAVELVITRQSARRVDGLELCRRAFELLRVGPCTHGSSVRSTVIAAAIVMSVRVVDDRLSRPPRAHARGWATRAAGLRASHLPICHREGLGDDEHGDRCAAWRMADRPNQIDVAQWVAQHPPSAANALSKKLETPPLARLSSEPSVGLEPTTPSLPWKCSTS
jgi:hypothetical protein